MEANCKQAKKLQSSCYGVFNNRMFKDKLYYMYIISMNKKWDARLITFSIAGL